MNQDKTPKPKKPPAKPKAVEKRPAGNGTSATDKSKPVTSVPSQTQPKKNTTQKADSKKDGVTPIMSEAQKRAIYNLSRRRGISVDDLEKMAGELFGVSSVEDLPPQDASAFIRQLQQAA